ncbi:putative Metallo-hydrolase/oxidoreductase [Vibrio nigripulchritudo SOn1]|uniref:Metallo-hydrolase/oxidoreductase n=1 Tax=Vibrio nigripulchritudo SOn1 TaxID=1238450 RepID=A0AAV2VRK8_9VIBR|nr:MBL fold metallo-hydrolase [Vibrio nigripulchritudo]CCO47105.1 putative Metallo-hydrolase/oxidoreductase [Vibrio nigripulchritudo SOn1]
MQVQFKPLVFDGELADFLSHYPQPTSSVSLFWLGQAGFLVRYQNQVWLIDPYLSDSLAEKYQGTRFPHIRMMKAPISPEQLEDLSGVFCTHKHTDHMDPATLQPIFRRADDVFLVAPRAESKEAQTRSGLEESKLTLVSDGEHIQLNEFIGVHVLPAAHETIERDEQGNSRFLGYVLDIAIENRKVRVWHSGDSIPFDGLVERVQKLKPDVALLPVNGRDEARRSNGVPGNFHLKEAIEICQQAQIPTLIAHHFGLFEFNTIEPEKICAAAQQNADSISVFPAQLNVEYRLRLRS